MTDSNTKPDTPNPPRSFSDLHPGPFQYAVGAEPSFDIYCSHGNEFIARVYFMDDIRQAETIAQAIVTALNARLGDHLSAIEKYRANCVPAWQKIGLDEEMLFKVTKWLQLGNQVGFDEQLTKDLIDLAAQID